MAYLGRAVFEFKQAREKVVEIGPVILIDLPWQCSQGRWKTFGKNAHGKKPEWVVPENNYISKLEEALSQIEGVSGVAKAFKKDERKIQRGHNIGWN